MKLHLIRLFSALAICFLAAGIGTFFTTDAINGWYATLNKPFFNPPNWLFGPIWTLLYTLMGISLYLVWQKKNKTVLKKISMIVFFIQLGLNTLWSIIFFWYKLPPAAFIEIILLWVSIFLTIKYFKKISPIAAALLYPYIAWVSFAAILNAAIVVLNT
jgi:tryptophan-rich sensory protein